MNTKARMILGITAMAISAGGIAACDGVVGVDANANANLAFAVDQVDSGLLGLGSSKPNEIKSGSHTLILESATMTASELELKGFSAGSGTSGSGSTGSGSSTTSKFETGPVTIDLPVEGGTSRNITTQIAAGSYNEFEMDVRSVRLKGTYDGAPFDVVVQVNDELELDLTPPLVVTDGSSQTSVTVGLDLQSWFRSATGDVLDPRQTSSDTTVAARMRSNIRGSFEAFHH